MQENEFEKQIKDAMDDLRVHPSESVWENVKKHLIKRKRRVLPFFLLFAFIALAGGYFMYSFEENEHTNTGKNKIANAATLSKQNIATNVQKENIKDKKLAVEKQIPNQASSENKTNTLTPQIVSIIKPPSKNKMVHSISNKKIEIKTDKKNNHSGNILHDSAIKILSTNNINTEQTKNNYQPKLDNAVNSNRDSLSNSGGDSVIHKAIQINQPSTIAHKKSGTSKNNKPGKWKFGVTAMYGAGNISSFANLNRDKSLSVSFSNPGTVQGASNPRLAHPYNSSEAYKFGFAMQRKLFGQSFLNTGINYIHISAKSVVATSANSSLVLVAASYQNNFTLNYYQLGTEQIFKSNYNFIELPITFQGDIFRIQTFSLAYNVGPSIRKLISSTPLIYDNNNYTFSKDKSLLKHTQFQLSAGLVFQFKFKNNALSLSPQFEYSVSKYAQNNNLHYSDYGLQATWLLGKK